MWMKLDPWAVLLGLATGASMAVAVSSVWVALKVPARLQGVFQAESPQLCTLVMGAGLLFAALENGVNFSFGFPAWTGSAALLLGGMFVGMVASALGEILEVVPVLFWRFGLGNASGAVRWVMLVGKGLGAVLGCLTFTL